MNELDLENFEIPACTLTRKVNHGHFPWGTYHLNLVSPIQVAKCKDTGMLYLCPRPSRMNRDLIFKGTLPDPLRDYGEKTYNYGAVDKLRTFDFEERVLKFNRLYSHRGRLLLDIGTSTGHFLEVSTKQGWNVKGVEPFEEDVEKCRMKGFDVIQGVAEILPYPDNTFDIVHTSHVFEHLEDPLKAAKEAMRVLKPGGLLFIEVPNQLDNFGFHRDVFFKTVHQRKRDIASIHHLWFFGRRTLHKLYKLSGYEKVKIENKYDPPFKGWRYPFSLTSRALSSFFYGTYIIRGYGFKPF